MTVGLVGWLVGWLIGYAVLDFLDDGIGRGGKGMICSITNKQGTPSPGDLRLFAVFFRFRFHVRDTTIIFHGSGLALVVRTQKGWLLCLDLPRNSDSDHHHHRI